MFCIKKKIAPNIKQRLSTAFKKSASNNAKAGNKTLKISSNNNEENFSS